MWQHSDERRLIEISNEYCCGVAAVRRAMAGRRNLYLSKDRPESYGIAARRHSRVKPFHVAEVSRSLLDRGVADIEAFGNRSLRPAVFVKPPRVIAAHVEHADSAVLARA